MFYAYRYAFTEETRKIYDSLTLTEEEKNNCGAILTAMETFARGVINETLERHNVNTRKQEDGENFDDFLTDLKLISKNCNFCDTCHNGLIRDRIVGGIRENKLRKKLLAELNLTIQKTEDICHAHEKATEGVESMKTKESTEQVDYIKHTHPTHYPGQSPYQTR